MAEHKQRGRRMMLECTLSERFQESLPPLSEREAHLEADRCLYCYDAPCTRACPTHIDVPAFIKKIATGNLAGSARKIWEANLLGATCARVCPVPELCEGACVLHDEKPIMISRLQRYTMDWAAARQLKPFEPPPGNGFKVAVVGAGPAGLSCAGELARLGFAVTCFERKHEAGGLDTYGIVVFREPVEVSRAEVKMIEDLGVEIKTGIAVGADLSFDELLAGYDAVFVGIGLAAVPTLEIPGENLPGVLDGLAFIEQTKVGDLNSIDCGGRVCVIGAGNTAIDCATVARRLGVPDVTIVYRRSQAEMPAYGFEYEFALSEGVRFLFQTQPVAVLGTGRVEGLRCVRTALGDPDVSGRRSPSPVSGSEFVVPCDRVIKAVGQVKHWDSLKPLVELGVRHKNGFVEVDEERCTAHPRIFAGGDCIRSQGEATTVNAVADGVLAARAIEKALVRTGVDPVCSRV